MRKMKKKNKSIVCNKHQVLALLNGATQIRVPATGYSMNPGDEFFVKEQWQIIQPREDPWPSIVYTADGEKRMVNEKWIWEYSSAKGDRKRPASQMTIRTTRFRYRVTWVAMERVQDISEEDAIASGYSEESFWEHIEDIIGYSVEEYTSLFQEFMRDYDGVPDIVADAPSWHNWLFSASYGDELWSENCFVWVFKIEKI